MKLLLCSLLIIASVLPLYSQIAVSGINEAQFVKLRTDNPLSGFFHNETGILLKYRSIDFGITFNANLPRYSQYQKVEELNSKHIYFDWSDIYLKATLPHLEIRAGNFSEHFGNGLILHAFQDKSLDFDKRLTGLNVKSTHRNFSLKALYGSVPNKAGEPETAGGADFSVRLFDSLTLGSSFLSSQEQRTDKKFRTVLLYGTRMEFNYDFVDLAGEYARSKLYRDAIVVNGEAIYGYLNTYLGNWTISGGYKKYLNFNHKLNNLPVMNINGEALTEKFPIGYDEEGLMGTLKYNHNFETELTLAYAEGWSSDYKERLRDVYAGISREFSSFMSIAEFSLIEIVDYETDLWEKRMIPSLKNDIRFGELSLTVKTQYTYKEFNKSPEIHNPMLQTDFAYDKYGVSIYAETEFNNFDEVKESKYWSGIELKADIFSHSELKLFAGSEKGGKMCRNGVCYYAAPFSGLRIAITTRF